MREILTSDLWVAVGLGVLLALFIASVWHLIQRLREARRAAAWLSQNAVPHLSGTAPGQSPSELARDAFSRLSDASAGQHGRAFILTRPLRQIIEPAFEAYFERGFGAAMGNAFTGIALIITFALIAKVLFVDVGPAIESSFKEASNSAELLKNSVALMGGKFVVSCVGIAFALVHQAIMGDLRRRLTAASDGLVATLSPSFIGIERVRLETESATLEELRRLHLIEVSVKDLGQEVTDGLRGILKETLARQIEQLLGDMKIRAEEMQDYIRGFVERELRVATDQLLAEIRAAHDTLRNQSGTQIEQLLSKLQDVVSGGFSSESRNISDQLAQFGTVFPAMAQQLTEVAQRMEGMLTQLEKQQAATIQVVEGVAEASRAHVHAMGQDLAKAGSDAMAKVLGETSERLEHILAGLRGAATQQATNADRVRENMTGVVEEIERSLQVVKQTSGTLQDLMKEVASAATAVGAQTTALASAAQGVERSSRSMLAVTNHLQQIEREVNETMTASARSQDVQRELLDQMQHVWPQLLESLSQRVAENSRTLDETWSRMADKLQRTITGAGQSFAVSVEELAEAVKEMRSAQQDARRTGSD